MPLTVRIAAILLAGLASGLGQTSLNIERAGFLKWSRTDLPAASPFPLSTIGAEGSNPLPLSL